MNHPLRVSVLGIAALAALVFVPAQAAFITWGPASNITGNSDVSTNGSLVAAYNFGSAAATTVNGVLFSGLLIGTPQVVSVSFDGNTLAIDPERQEHTLTNFATGSSEAGSPFVALSSEYQALLTSAAGGNFADRATRLILGGLTIGQTYEFQAWFNDSGTEGDFAFGLSISDGTNDVGLAPSTQKDSFDNYILGGTGQFVVGTFVADAATQDLFYTRGEVEGGINGFQLRNTTVPEPGSLALMILAALGLGTASSRRRSTARP